MEIMLSVNLKLASRENQKIVVVAVDVNYFNQISN
jgi:hypothetical protein